MCFLAQDSLAYADLFFARRFYLRLYHSLNFYPSLSFPCPLNSSPLTTSVERQVIFIHESKTSHKLCTPQVWQIS